MGGTQLRVTWPLADCCRGNNLRTPRVEKEQQEWLPIGSRAAYNGHRAAGSTGQDRDAARVTSAPPAARSRSSRLRTPLLAAALGDPAFPPRVTSVGRGASSLRHFLPLPVWTVGGGRPAPRRSPPLFPPSLSLPPSAAASRGGSRAGLGVSAGRRGGLRRRTPAARASRHPARRRHGHEADAAHLLRPHAARGGLGLQRHHALRLFSDQRL